ncbi:DUF2846 domain-containing protein [Rhizobacter sp. P5_C2]
MHDHSTSIRQSRRLAIAWCCTALAGCAATGPAFQRAPAPHGDQALVYIYRPQGGPLSLSMRDAYFYVDGQNVGDLSSQGYTRFYVPAGEHELEQKWPLDVVGLFGRPLRMKLTWGAQQTYYLRFIVEEPRPGNYPVILTTRYVLSQPSPQSAMNEIQAMKYQQPRIENPQAASQPTR